MEEGEKREEQVEEAEEERGERPKLVMMRRMESETTSYDWSTDSESLRSDLSIKGVYKKSWAHYSKLLSRWKFAFEKHNFAKTAEHLVWFICFLIKYPFQNGNLES